MNAARFDTTGRRIVYVDAGGRVAVHDCGPDAKSASRRLRTTFYDAQVSPDGRRVAPRTGAGKLLVWRLDRPARPERVRAGHHGDVNGSLAPRTAGSSPPAPPRHRPGVGSPGAARVVLRGHTDEVNTADSASGARVLSVSADGMLRLGRPRRRPARRAWYASGTVNDVAHSRDGTIATLGRDAVVRVFKGEVCGSLDQVRALARSRALRLMTPAERQRFVAAAG